MQSHAIRGVLFDLDGTLVDSLAVTHAAFNAGIVSQGGHSHSWEELTRYFGTGEDQIFAQILGWERAPAAYAECREYLARHMHAVPLHAGVSLMLDALRERSLPVSIVTGRSWNTTEMILKHHDCLDRFVTVVANDHVAKPKPSPLGLELALSRMGLAPSQALYVGDSDVDIQAAQAAGCRSVAALWDARAHQKALTALKPDTIAHRPEAILELL